MVQALIGWALISGLAVHWTRAREEAVAVFGILPRPEPPAPETKPPHPMRSEQAEGEASPPNIRSEATELVAPPPIVIPPIPPPPIVTAATAGPGLEATTGAALVPGPGAGAGGVGDGRGGGGRGNGDGAGGYETPPRWLKGSLKDSDFPSSASEAGFEGTVSVRFLVGVTGRVTECDVTRSSGSAELDATTCSLIRKRFRYDPSRDARGRPVPAFIVENHSWVIQDDPSPAARS